MSRSRNWLTLSSVVSMTTSAMARMVSSRSPLQGDGLGHPSLPRGWRRRVPSKRRTSTSSDASRNSVRTFDPLARSWADGRLQLVELLGVAPDRPEHPVRGRPRGADQLRHLGDQGGRHVVDHEPARGPRGSRRPETDPPLTVQ